jgi:pantetheine-phosphate adenylyltransferase
MAVAFYPGSFDPFHLGHLDVVEQAVALFGDLVIGVMHNPDKPSGMFSPAERAELVHQSVAHLGKKVCVETYSGLTVEAASQISASFIIKSARTGADFEIEQQMAQTNHGASGIESILLFSRPEHSFISSRYIRQFVDYNGTNAKPMVSPTVLKALIAKQKLGAKK